MDIHITQFVLNLDLRRHVRKVPVDPHVFQFVLNHHKPSVHPCLDKKTGGWYARPLAALRSYIWAIRNRQMVGGSCVSSWSIHQNCTSCQWNRLKCTRLISVRYAKIWSIYIYEYHMHIYSNYIFTYIYICVCVCTSLIIRIM